MQVPHLLQDIGTSYKPGYGGGWRSEDSFVEFAKAKIDELQAIGMAVVGLQTGGQDEPRSLRLGREANKAVTKSG